MDYAVPSSSGMMNKKMLFYKGLDDHRVSYYIKPIQLLKVRSFLHLAPGKLLLVDIR